jgi:TPR repeat protein
MFGIFKKKQPIDLKNLTHKQIEQLIASEDPKKLGEILREAAEMGNLASQESLSILYLQNYDHARSTDPSNAEMINFMERNAEHFTKLAAEQGHVKSQFNLGKFYLGKGVRILQKSDNYYTEESKKYFRDSERWYKSAALQGDQGAITALRECDETFQIARQ